MYRLRKALYGLKQAPRAWNKKIDGFLSHIGFEKCVLEDSVYLKSWKVGKNTEMLIVCLYVHDLLTIGSNESEIEKFKQDMMSEFKMSDLGFLSYFLGIEFKTTQYGIVMH